MAYATGRSGRTTTLQRRLGVRRRSRRLARPVRREPASTCSACRSSSAASAADQVRADVVSVACAPQSWAAGAVSLILQSCLGLSIDAVEGQVNVSHAPQVLDRVTIHGLIVGPGTSLDLLALTALDRQGGGVRPAASTQRRPIRAALLGASVPSTPRVRALGDRPRCSSRFRPAPSPAA
jgi:hypothetical protein